MWKDDLGRVKARRARPGRFGRGVSGMAMVVSGASVAALLPRVSPADQGDAVVAKPLPTEVERAVAAYVARELGAVDEPTPSAAWPPSVADQPFGVYLALRSSGRLLGESWTEEQPLASALTGALARARFQIGEKEQRQIDTVELDLAYRFRRIEPIKDSALLTDDHRGVVGLRMVREGEVAVWAPTQMLAMNLGFGNLVRTFQRRADGSPVEIWLFDAHQVLVRLTSPPEAVGMFRGNRAVPMTDVTADTCKAFTQKLLHWMERQLQPDGNMVFKYWPSSGRALTESDAVDHFITAWALQRAAVALGTPELAEQAADLLALNLRRYYRAEGDRGVIEHEGKNPLGAVALAALAIRDSPQRKSYAEVEARLCATADHLWKEDGTFRALPEGADQGAVDVGAALVLLADIYAESRDAQRLDRLNRSLAHYREAGGNAAAPEWVGWLTSAYAKVWTVTEDEGHAQAILKMNDGLVDLQEWEQAAYPDLRGRFVSPDASGHDVLEQGPVLESLIVAYRVAKESSDEKRAERYRVAIVRGLRHMMQLQFVDDVDLFYIVEKERADGGLRTAVYRNEIRVDRAVPALLAMLEIVHAFSAEEFGSSTPP